LAYRLITTDTINYFEELLLKETWEEIYLEHGINEIYNAFLKTHLTIFEVSFPIIYCDKYKDNDWITKGIRISCQWKKSLYLLSRNCMDLKLKMYYKRYYSILRKTIRGAKKLYYYELIAKSENKNKMTWKIVKNLKGKTQNSQQVFPTFKEDGVEQSPEAAVEAFNNYFLKVTENLNIHVA
jgi:hypothetical protein